MLIAFPDGFIMLIRADQVEQGMRMVWPNGQCLVVSRIERDPLTVALHTGNLRERSRFRSQVRVGRDEPVPILVS